MLVLVVVVVGMVATWSYIPPVLACSSTSSGSILSLTTLTTL